VVENGQKGTPVLSGHEDRNFLNADYIPNSMTPLEEQDFSMFIGIPQLDLERNSTYEEDLESFLSGLETNEEKAEWLSWLKDFDSALEAKGVTQLNFKYSCPTPPGTPPVAPREEKSNWLNVETNADLRK
jgi:hypothetical protein